jgi:Cu+-exporting ATPase
MGYPECRIRLTGPFPGTGGFQFRRHDASVGGRSIASNQAISTGLRDITLRIDGLKCGGCVQHVERALRAVPGVSSVSVNLATRIGHIVVSEGIENTETLVAAVRAAGYDASPTEGDSGAAAELLQPPRNQALAQRRALLTVAVLVPPVIALEWVPSHFWTHALQGSLCLVLLISWAGWPILRSGARAVLHRAPNMDSLIALGASAAMLAGWAGLFLGADHLNHFHAGALILGFVNLGKYFEAKALREAGGAVAALARRLPTQALRLQDGQIESVEVSAVRLGDHLVVPDQTTVPVDGRIIAGQAAVDQSALTGESLPVEKGEGDSVMAGSVVRGGQITVQATAVGAEAALGRILRTVQEAQSGKTRLQRLADRAAGVFVPVVALIALGTLLGWLVVGEVEQALRAAIAVLVIACPCAMGLATPTAVLVATGAAALKGILVRDAAALEAAGSVNTVLLDKTGTLTTGVVHVKEVLAEPAGAATRDAREVLRLAAAAEQFSQHPLARAIVARAREWGLALAEPQSFASRAGLGTRAEVEGAVVVVGSPAHLAAEGIGLGPAEARCRQAAAGGCLVVAVAVDGSLAGLIALADALRPEAAAAVAALEQLGLAVVMITGDGAATADAVASAVGIKTVMAETLPEAKQAEVSRRRSAGERVAFVGDGINDAPALVTADVGMAFATGTDVALEAADIMLTHDDLGLVAEAIRIARRSVAIIKQNLFWAVAYNAVAIPLAVAGHVPPGVAAAAMMGSSLSVVLNSLRLRAA